MASYTVTLHAPDEINRKPVQPRDTIELDELQAANHLLKGHILEGAGVELPEDRIAREQAESDAAFAARMADIEDAKVEAAEVDAENRVEADEEAGKRRKAKG